MTCRRRSWRCSSYQRGRFPSHRYRGSSWERLLSEFYFCDSAEEITVLVASGYGILALLALLLPDMPLIAKLPLKDTELVSFGIYYRALQGNPALRALIQCVREYFAQPLV